MANKRKKWRRFLAFLRKYTVAVRNIAIFIVIIVVICWCRSQIHRDANTRAFNEAVAKLTRGPQKYHEAVKDLEALEHALSTQRKNAGLLLEVRKQLSECCAMIANDRDLCETEDAALTWYHRAWKYNADEELIPLAVRTHFAKQTVAADLVEVAEIETNTDAQQPLEKANVTAEGQESAKEAAVVEATLAVAEPQPVQPQPQPVQPQPSAQEAVASESEPTLVQAEAVSEHATPTTPVPAAEARAVEAQPPQEAAAADVAPEAVVAPQ